MSGISAALLARVGETQILKLKKPEDDEQDTGLDIIIEFDGSTTFPAWVINNGDMSFKIIPNSNADAGNHEMKITVSDQPQYHCECVSESITVTAGIEVQAVEEKVERTIDDFVFEYDFTVSKETTDQPTMEVKQVDSNGILTLAFSKPVFAIKEPEIYVDVAVMELKILTEYDIFDPEKMLVSWQTISMTETEI